VATRTLSKSTQKEALGIAGRAGLAVRGVTYLVVGALSLLVAAHRPTAPPDRHGALEAVARLPLGRLLVTLLALGFLAFAIWRLGEAVKGEGVTTRVADAGRAVLYAAFFLSAIPYVLHRKATRNGNAEVDVTARVLRWPGGRWLVIAVGLWIIAAGAWNGYRALSQRYRKKLKWRDMGPRMKRVVPPLATAGLIGRMAAFVLIGGFVVNAGWDYRPDDAGGLDVALLRTVGRGYGPALVTLIGLGVALFGVYSLIEARYREL
jgi:hypothetical protein